MKVVISLFVFLIYCTIAFAAEDVNISEITDISDIDKLNNQENSTSNHQLKISGSLVAKWQIDQNEYESPYNRLNYYGSDLNPYSSLYVLGLNLNCDYSGKDYGLHIKTNSTYISEENIDFTIYEAYNYLNIGSFLSLEFGKRIFGWGKGYVINPVGYFNSKKDIENPGKTQEGVLASNIEITKSYNSDILRTTAFTFVVLPSSPVINDRYGEIEKIEFGTKLYLLFFDTDIDFLSHFINERHSSYGFNFSRNIGDNFEFHGELNYFINQQVNIIKNDFNLNSKDINGLSYLIGFRFVPWYDFIFIGEYYHNDAGLSKDEYKNYLSFIERSISGNDPTIMQKAKGIVKKNLASQMLMRDYIYLKITRSDILGILYLSMSPYILTNIQDMSFIAGLEISYNPYSNFELSFRRVSFFGKHDTEYGSNQKNATYEFEMSVYY